SLSRSTRFPYTTLFRSYHKKRAVKSAVFFQPRTPPCQLRFRFAPSQSRAIALWKSRNDQPEECKHSSARRLRRANFDSAPLHLRSEEHTSELQSRFDLV